MNKELANRIVADLKKSGFSTELSARKILIDAGWSVDAGCGYLDKDQNKSREIDIVATSVANLRHGEKVYLYSEFHICAEVKKSKSPWVVFDQKTHPALLSCAWNNLTSNINLPTEARFLTEGLTGQSLVKLNGWAGSGIHESFKNPDQPSRWYSSFVSVSKASEYYLETAAPEGDPVTDDIFANPCEMHFVQPLVILDGPLFRAVLTDAGDIELTEIENAAFKFDYKSKNYETSNFRVDLVTIGGLEPYIKTVKARQADFGSAIKEAANPDA